MEKVKFYTLDEVKDKHIGKIGTPQREKYEAELHPFLVGEAIKQARKAQNMTQQELAEKIGVQRAQVSKIESGRNLTLSTISRCFKAMGLEASLSVSGLGRSFIADSKRIKNTCRHSEGNFLAKHKKTYFEI